MGNEPTSTRVGSGRTVVNAHAVADGDGDVEGAADVGDGEAVGGFVALVEWEVAVDDDEVIGGHGGVPAQGSGQDGFQDGNGFGFDNGICHRFL